MTASGTFGYGLEFADFVNLEDIGGIIVKGTTLKPREGNPYPRMAETPQGMLNCVGLQNKGVDYFCGHIYPQIKDIRTNMIVNVSGSCCEDYAECAARINELERIPAIELNISCPNVKQGGMAFGVTAEGASAVVKAVRKAYDKTLIVKLSPNGRRRSGCREPYQYVDGNGYRHRKTSPGIVHSHRGAERSGCEARGITYGMASSQSGEDTRGRFRGNHERA